jgi:inorganic triphosphatase YgiF
MLRCMPHPPDSDRAPASTSREVELKLIVAPEAMATIEAAPLLLDMATRAPVVRQLNGIYYDTADLRLARRQMSLRVRRSGRRRVQTFKTAAERGEPLADRGEWEVEIEGDEPRLSAFADPRAAEIAGLGPKDRLLPVFATHVRRKVLPVLWPNADAGGARIEVAFDSGRIEASGRHEPICEIELELLAGPPQALIEAATVLRRLAPLRISRLDKAARGYRLATGRPLAAVKAAPLRLDAADTVETALTRVLKDCLAHALSNEAPAAEGIDIEGVHQLRVALRRLRSALPLFRDVVPEAARARWKVQVQWLLSALGPCRDLDVLLTGLLPPLTAGGDADDAVEALRLVAVERRKEAQLDLREALTSQRAADFFLDLAGWIEAAGWRGGADAQTIELLAGPIEAHVARSLDRRDKQLRKRGKGFAGLDAAHRHRVRIAAKKLRYGLEFFSSLLPRKKVRSHLAALRRFQESLGHMNDIDVARRLVGELVAGLPDDDERRLAAAEGGGQIVGWHAHVAAQLEPLSMAAWREVKAQGRCWRHRG